MRNEARETCRAFAMWARFTVSLFLMLFAAVPAVQGAPVTGGHLTVVQSAEPPGLDPSATTATATSSIIHHNVMEGLVKVDEMGNIVPGLAHSWSIAPDATEYTFYLRENVRFHNGQLFSAADVTAKFDLARDPASTHTNKAYYEAIAAIEAPDAHTVVFRMHEADAEFLYNLARPDSVIAPAGTEGTRAAQPVGTGPFRLENWVRGSHITLTRFDDYYEPELPYLDAVTFRFITDANAQVAALLAGDADAVAGAVTAEQALQVELVPGFKVVEGPTTNTVVLSMNNGRGPLDDVRVRRAINHAIDRDEIMLGAEFGYGTPIGSHMTPAEPYYVELIDTYPHDVQRARELLAAAGYADGLRLTLSLPNQYPYAVRVGEIIAAQLARVGVTANIELVEWPTWLSRIFTDANYDMTVIGHAEPMDIGIYANPDYYFRYDSGEVRALLDAARQAVDEDERHQLYTFVQQRLAHDAVNAWLYARPQFILSRDDVHGWWERVPMVITDVTRVYVDR